MNISVSSPAEPPRARPSDKSSADNKEAPGKFDEALSGTSSGVQSKSDASTPQRSAQDAAEAPSEDEGEASSGLKPGLDIEDLFAGKDELAALQPGVKEKQPVDAKSGKTAKTAAEDGATTVKKDGLTKGDDESTLLDLLKNVGAEKAETEVQGDTVVAETHPAALQAADTADALSLLAAASNMQKAAAGKEAQNDTGSVRKAEARDKSAAATQAVTGDEQDAATAARTGTSDSTFRFVSSRSGASGVDLRIDNARNTAEFRNASSGGNAENIMVLDSRRFMGLAPSSNGAALANLISSDGEWASALRPGAALSNAAAQSSTGGVVHTLKLQLNPIDLGAVTMSLRLKGDELVVHLAVENRAAYKQLSDDSRGIVDMLRAQGYTVDQVSVSIAATDKGTGSQPGGQQQSTAGQQQAAEGQNRDSGTREGAGGNRNGNGSESVSDELLRSGAAAGAGGGDVSSGIYL